jgi:hypothetical protein
MYWYTPRVCIFQALPFMYWFTPRVCIFQALPCMYWYTPRVCIFQALPFMYCFSLYILTRTERACSPILILVFLCQHTLRVDMVLECACRLSRLVTGLADDASSSDPSSPVLLRWIVTGVGSGNILHRFDSANWLSPFWRFLLSNGNKGNK